MVEFKVVNEHAVRLQRVKGSRGVYLTESNLKVMLKALVEEREKKAGVVVCSQCSGDIGPNGGGHHMHCPTLAHGKL